MKTMKVLLPKSCTVYVRIFEVIGYNLKNLITKICLKIFQLYGTPYIPSPSLIINWTWQVGISNLLRSSYSVLPVIYSYIVTVYILQLQHGEH